MYISPKDKQKELLRLWKDSDFSTFLNTFYEYEEKRYNCEIIDINKPIYNAEGLYKGRQTLDISSFGMLACEIVYKGLTKLTTDENPDGVGIKALRDYLLNEKPYVNLKSLASYLKNNHPDIRAHNIYVQGLAKRKETIRENLSNSRAETKYLYLQQLEDLQKEESKGNLRAWKALLTIDKKLFDKKIFENLINQELDGIDNIIPEEGLLRAKQLLKINKGFVINAISKKIGVKPKDIQNGIKRITELEEILTDLLLSEPEEDENGGSFTEFNKYIFNIREVKKELNKISVDIQKLEQFFKTSSLKDLLDTFENEGLTNILAGDEDTINHQAEKIIANNKMKWMIKLQKEELTEENIYGYLRATDITAVKRELRRKMRQGNADIASCLGLVNGRKNNKNSHCHTSVSAHKKEMEIKNEKWAKQVLVKIKGKDNEGVSLQEIKTSNQLKQLANMNSIMKGYELYAEANDLLPLFITYTLPPSFHSAPKSLGFQKNKEWEYSKHNCVEARKKISEDFSHFRARLKKVPEFRGVFGLRVNEFHQDGCPHIHALMFFPKSYRDKKGDTQDTFTRVENILADMCKDRKGGNGYDIQIIDKEEGGASVTSYVMKYIRKSLQLINPEEMDENCEFTKYRAMLSASGARAFSFIGSRGIRGLWNRLYNSDAKEFEELGDDWQTIADEVHTSKKLWNNTKELNADEDEDNINDLKRISRNHTVNALKLLNAFPANKQRYKISGAFSDTENKYGEKTKKQTGYVLIDEHTEKFILPLKKFDVELQPTAKEDEKDFTGIRKQRQRKTVIETLSPVFSQMNKKDINILGNIFNSNIADIHHYCDRAVAENSNKNMINDNNNNKMVSLILTDSRAEASPQLMNVYDCLESEEDTKKDALSVGMIALEALRHLYEPHICP